MYDVHELFRLENYFLVHLHITYYQNQNENENAKVFVVIGQLNGIKKNGLEKTPFFLCKKATSKPEGVGCLPHRWCGVLHSSPLGSVFFEAPLWTALIRLRVLSHTLRTRDTIH